MLAEIKAAKRKTLETPSAPAPSSGKPSPTMRPDDQISVPDKSSTATLPSAGESVSSQLSQLSLQQSPQQMHQQIPQPSPPMMNRPSTPQQGVMPPNRMNMPQPQMTGPPGQPYPPYHDPRYQQQQQQPYPPPHGIPRPPMMQPQQQNPYAPIPNPAVMGRPPYNQQGYPPMDVAPPRVSFLTKIHT